MLALCGWSVVGAILALPRATAGDTELLRWSARLLVSSMFLIAGGRKLLTPTAFANVVQAYRIIPPRLACAFGGLPYVEIAAGAALLGGVAPRVMSGIAVALLTMFTAAIVVNLVRGHREVGPGCFGTSAGDSLGWHHVIRNGALTANAVVTGLAPATVPTPTPIALMALGIAGTGGLAMAVVLWQVGEMRRVTSL